jgi:hypothetical protein
MDFSLCAAARENDTRCHLCMCALIAQRAKLTFIRLLFFLITGAHVCFSPRVFLSAVEFVFYIYS